MIGSTDRTERVGYRVTWGADLRTSPDPGDTMPYLRDGLRALRGHPEVASAACRYRRSQARVEFDVTVGHALTPDFALVRAQIALRESLDRAGLGGAIRLDRAPVAVQRP